MNRLPVDGRALSSSQGLVSGLSHKKRHSLSKRFTSRNGHSHVVGQIAQDGHVHEQKAAASTVATTKARGQKQKQKQNSQSKPPSTGMILDDATRKFLQRIVSHPSLTSNRRLVYWILLSVPRVCWTIYAIMSAHLLFLPRAIRNVMRTNPFLPEVPCPCVLATDRTIGGYKDDWGNGGSYAVEKTKLRHGEGIVFDGMGRADGEPFNDFVDMSTVDDKKL